MIVPSKAPGAGALLKDGPAMGRAALLRTGCRFEIMLILLNVASHIAIQHHPNLEWPVDLLNLFERVGVRRLDLDAEVLLLVNVDRLGEAESGRRRRLAVRGELARFGIGARAGREEPRRHRNHDLLADEESGDGVVNQLADYRARAVVGADLLFGRRFLIEVVDA